MPSVDRGQEEYGSSVKGHFLEVAAEWSLDGSEGGEVKGMLSSSSMSMLRNEAF